MKKYDTSKPTDDPSEGMKAFGCLFAGVLILLAIGYIALNLIKHIR